MTLSSFPTSVAACPTTKRHQCILWFDWTALDGLQLKTKLEEIKLECLHDRGLTLHTSTGPWGDGWARSGNQTGNHVESLLG